MTDYLSNNVLKNGGKAGSEYKSLPVSYSENVNRNAETKQTTTEQKEWQKIV